MRLRRSDLRVRVNGNLALRYEAAGLTSFAGFELLRRYFNLIGLRGWIRERLDPLFKEGDFPVVSMVMLVLALIIGGGRRSHHLGYLQGDPMVARLCGLARMPTSRTVGRWLERFDQRRLAALAGVNERLVADTLQGAVLKSLTLDVDGSVISTGLKVKGAARGFNPHRRKVPSYYPISAYAAELGQIVRVENRPGNIHDGAASTGFLARLFDQLRHEVDAGLRLLFRMDGAFFRADVVDMMELESAQYAIKVPFWQHLKLKEKVAMRQRWQRIDQDLSCFATEVEINAWGRTLAVMVYRRRVAHATRKNYQLDLFDPADGHYEYSAIATNMALPGDVLWTFMCGRGTQEKAYGELKTGFAFDCVPTQHEDANSAWQILSVLAFNLTRAFQAATTAIARPSDAKRITLYRFESISTLRFKLFNRAGMVVNPQGRPTLEVGTAPNVMQTFENVRKKLALAA